MIDLEIGVYRKARIWLDELPPAGFDSPKNIRYSIPTTTFWNRPSELKRFCIEYKVPLGGRTGYGLLGSSFEMSSSNTLSIDILTSEGNWTMFTTDFYRGPDPIFVGLPEVFAESIKAALHEHFAKASAILPGRWTFHCAAHSEVASSEHIFSQLALVNGYYMFSNSSASKAKLKEIFELVGL